MMNAAAEGTPPWRIRNKELQKPPALPCLGEALMRGIVIFCELFVHPDLYKSLNN